MSEPERHGSVYNDTGWIDYPWCLRCNTHLAYCTGDGDDWRERA